MPLVDPVIRTVGVVSIPVSFWESFCAVSCVSVMITMGPDSGLWHQVGSYLVTV